MEGGFPIQEVEGVKRPAERDSSASGCYCSTVHEVQAGCMATVRVDEHCTGEDAARDIYFTRCARCGNALKCCVCLKALPEDYRSTRVGYVIVAGAKRLSCSVRVCLIN